MRVGKAPEALRDALKEIIAASELSVDLEETTELPGSSLRSWVTKQMKLGQPIPSCFGVYAPMKAIQIAKEVAGPS